MGTNLNRKTIFSSPKKGNKTAFEKIFHLYYPRLKKYAFYFLKNQEEAEDLVQDAFFQVWEQRQNLNDEKHISSYLFTLVKNRCLNAIKRKVVEGKYLTSQAKIESEELYHIGFLLQIGCKAFENVPIR